MSAAIPQALLDARFPPAVLAVLERLTRAGHRAYLVGGCVRDVLRGVSPKDFDVATSALPTEVQGVFPKVIPTGIQHGTVTVLHGGEKVEVTTFRSEGPYLDARRPSSVHFEKEVEEDLSRRDFTINAMAYDPVTKDFRDPYSGATDLTANLIRCVGEARARFGEDGLRPLRAVRFAAVLGFTIVEDTEAAIAPVLASFRKVAVERVREEFLKLLLSRDPATGLALLLRTGLLEGFLPELAALPNAAFTALAAAVGAERLHSADVRLAILLHPLGPKPANLALTHLKFPTRTVEDVMSLLRHPLPENADTWSDPDFRRWLSALPPSFTPAAVELLARRTNDQSRADVVGARLRELLATRPPLTAKDLALKGNDLMKALGTGPGPQIGQATRFLLEQVLDDPSLNSPSGLMQTLEKWKGSQGG